MISQCSVPQVQVSQVPLAAKSVAPRQAWKGLGYWSEVSGVRGRNGLKLKEAPLASCCLVVQGS